jgi:hypothetical protein
MSVEADTSCVARHAQLDAAVAELREARRFAVAGIEVRRGVVGRKLDASSIWTSRSRR